MTATAFGFGAAQLRGVLRVGPFFDEMWRIDLIRSHDVYERSINGVSAPIAWGWLYLYKGLNPIIGGSWGGFRLAALAMSAAGLGVLALLLGSWFAPAQSTRAGRILAWGSAVATAITFPLLPVYIGVERWFNNYLFEAAITIGLVFLVAQLPHSKLARRALLAVVPLAPAFVISSLAIVPGIYAAAAWYSWNERRVRGLIAVGASACATGVTGLAVYLSTYARVSNPALRRYWEGETIGTGDGDPLRITRTFELLRAGLIGELAPSTDGVWSQAASVMLVVAFVVGVVAISRRWVWFPVVLASGWVMTAAASLVADAPVTPVRVTLGYYVVVYIATVFGFWHLLSIAIGRITERLPGEWAAIALSAVVGAVVLAVLWPPAPSFRPGAFARGLNDDLQLVVDSGASENLVLSYHFMSVVYTHDRLVNRAPPGGRFTVLRESPGDRSLYEDVDSLARSHLPRGGALWCIVPYVLGPAGSEQACQVRSPEIVEVSRWRGQDAEIVEYRVPRS